MRHFMLIVLTVVSFLIAKGETYVVCVGIANYADSKVRNLSKTETDAKAIAEFYKKGTENVITLTGKYATKERILNSVRSQCARTKADDKIIFFFSGHGYPGGFCPYDMKAANAEEKGLSYSEIIGIMSCSKAKTKIIFADACHSGGIRGSFPKRELQGGNVLLFLSSRGYEYSAESPLLANGYFTKYLLRGLGGGADSNRDRRVTARELYDFVSDGVRSQTSDRQHPVMWGKFDENLVIVEYRKR